MTQNVALNKVNDANPLEGPVHVTDDFLWHRRMKIGMVLNLNTCGELSVKFQQQREYQGALKKIIKTKNKAIFGLFSISITHRMQPSNEHPGLTPDTHTHKHAHFTMHFFPLPSRHWRQTEADM